MKCDTRFIRQRGSADSDMHAPHSQLTQKLCIQTFADTLSFSTLVQVDGGFNRVAVGTAHFPLARAYA